MVKRYLLYTTVVPGILVALHFSEAPYNGRGVSIVYHTKVGTRVNSTSGQAQTSALTYTLLLICSGHHIAFSVQAGHTDFTALRSMLMETRSPKVIFINYSKRKPAEDTLVPPLWGKREKKRFVFLGIFVYAALRGGNCAFTLKFFKTLIKNSLRDDRPSISTQEQPTANPVRVGQGR